MKIMTMNSQTVSKSQRKVVIIKKFVTYQNRKKMAYKLECERARAQDNNTHKNMILIEHRLRDADTYLPLLVLFYSNLDKCFVEICLAP